MSENRQPLSNLLRIALLLLLLSMQSVTLAHELDRSTVHDGGVCAVCSIGGHNNGAIDSQPCCPVEITVVALVTESGNSPTAEPARHTPEARAPPSSC